MKDAAARFVGTHDFTSFAASTGSEDDDKERNMQRDIFSTELRRTEDGEELWFTVHGRSFLRYMVRKMGGALLEVGTGKISSGGYRQIVSVEGSLEIRAYRASAGIVHGYGGSRFGLSASSEELSQQLPVRRAGTGPTQARFSRVESSHARNFSVCILPSI